MAEDLYTTLNRRLDEAFERNDSYYPILRHAVYAPLQGILDAAAPSVSCKSGCDRCCSRLVVTTRIEGLALADYLYGYSHRDIEKTEKDISLHAEKLRNFMESLSADSPKNETWFSYNIPCPFLEDSICSVYDARPLSCRTYHSLDDPVKCAEPLRKVGQEKMLIDAEALFQMFVYRAASRVDERLAMTGLFSIIMDDIIKSDMLKK